MKRGEKEGEGREGRRGKGEGWKMKGKNKEGRTRRGEEGKAEKEDPFVSSQIQNSTFKFVRNRGQHIANRRKGSKLARSVTYTHIHVEREREYLPLTISSVTINIGPCCVHTP